MGKLMNPMTGVVERNLDHAKFCIDVLGVLEEKTRNNLTDEEQRTLKYILQDLRLNFVAENTRPDGDAGTQPDAQAPDDRSRQPDPSRDGE